MKYLVFKAHMLTDIRTGMHTVWLYYSDGTQEITYEKLSPAFIPPMPLRIW